MKDETVLNRLKDNLEGCRSNIQVNVLDRFNYIVEVGGMTAYIKMQSEKVAKRVTDSSMGEVDLHLALYPTQFSEKAAAEIMSMKFKNGDGDEVKPKLWNWRDWYNNRIKSLEETIEMIESNQVQS